MTYIFYLLFLITSESWIPVGFVGPIQEQATIEPTISDGQWAFWGSVISGVCVVVAALITAGWIRWKRNKR